MVAEIVDSDKANLYEVVDVYVEGEPSPVQVEPQNSILS